MSVTYVNKKGEYVEVSPCFTRIRDLELPDLNATHPKELKSTINSFLTNPIKIPTVIYNPILENIQIRNELEKEKKARLILEEKVKKLENTVFCPKPTANLVTISKGKFIEVSPQLDKFDDLGLTCPPPKDKKPYKRESTGWH